MISIIIIIAYIITKIQKITLTLHKGYEEDDDNDVCVLHSVKKRQEEKEDDFFRKNFFLIKKICDQIECLGRFFLSKSMFEHIM